MPIIGRKVIIAGVAALAVAGCSSGPSQTGTSHTQADATVCANANIVGMQAANQALPSASPALRTLVSRWETDLQAYVQAGSSADPSNPAAIAATADVQKIDDWCSSHGYATF